MRIKIGKMIIATDNNFFIMFCPDIKMARIGCFIFSWGKVGMNWAE